MSLKLIAFSIFVIGVILLVSFFVYEGKKREKEKAIGTSGAAPACPGKTNKLPVPPTKTGSVHDLFRDDEEVTGDNPAVEPILNPYDGYVADKFLINHKQNAIYERLEHLLAGDFRISPKIRITDIIRPEKSIIETDPERAKVLNDNFKNARFDFVVTDLNTGEIRGIVMAENTLTTLSSGQFIAELLNKMNIPLFRYADTSDISDDELSNLLYEKFEEARND
ncbi:DUF2726 domain-containing protein [Klebsiella oxytoca]|uniref:DUF2726 domain-containing protein n=1 Tax=Klebsiella oxytoca TaxID=571 RepID=A0AAP2FLM7_KLEOX|nr:DUF2726 domain-containing protein [Klebsiella oxytoca]MBQ0600882.1 DUF2726 domain-containing protein [Klebsiella oxytoca]